MIIFIRPAYDPPTKSMARWAQKSINVTSEKHDLAGSSAKETNLRKSLLEHRNAQLIAFYGHGGSNCLIGYDPAGSGIPIVHVTGPGLLPNELKGRKLFATA